MTHPRQHQRHNIARHLGILDPLLLEVNCLVAGVAATLLPLYHEKEAPWLEYRISRRLQRPLQSRCGRKLLEGRTTRQGEGTALAHHQCSGKGGRIPVFLVPQVHLVLLGRHLASH